MITGYTEDFQKHSEPLRYQESKGIFVFNSYNEKLLNQAQDNCCYLV